MQENTATKVLGWVMAGGGSLVAIVQDQVVGMSVTGAMGVLGIVVGTGIVLHGRWKEHRRNQNWRDAEAKLKIEDLEWKQKKAWEKEHAEMLSGQIEALRASMAEQAIEHKQEAEAATRFQELLKASLTESNEALARLRKTNHEITNQLQPLMLERDQLKAALVKSNACLDELHADLARQSRTSGRTEAKVDRIEAKVTRLSDSGHEIPTSLAPTPPQSPG